jgi:tRNA (adenine37-N6)-methyltransferase
VTPALRVIGTICTPYTVLADTPVQAALNARRGGTIRLDQRYADALDGLEEFTHAWLITWLASGEDVTEPALKQVPFLLKRQPRELGILATRGPRRPNPIGLSLVPILAIDGAIIHFTGVDMLDGTALLDIKPYVDRFDRPTTNVRCGWFDSVTFDGNITPASLEPTDGSGDAQR